MTEKVSIIVPVYNNANSLIQSLRSLFDQTLNEIEIIAVNDASTDQSGDILDELAQRESRLNVIHLRENVGVHETRSAGLRVAKADYIGFLDADDFAKPDMFFQLHRALTLNQADIAICGADLVTPHRRFIATKVKFPRSETVSKRIFGTFCDTGFGTGTLWNKLYRRDIILKHGQISFRRRQESSEDTLINIGCFMNAKKVQLVKGQFVDYVLHQSSATQSINSTTSFVRMLGAYSEAVNIYRNQGDVVLEKITNLYSKQFDYKCYWVNEISELYNHEPELIDSMLSLAQQYPIGLAALLNRGPITNTKKPSIKRSVKTWIGLSLSIPKICVQLLWKGICRKSFQ